MSYYLIIVYLYSLTNREAISYLNVSETCFYTTDYKKWYCFSVRSNLNDFCYIVWYSWRF